MRTPASRPRLVAAGLALSVALAVVAPPAFAAPPVVSPAPKPTGLASSAAARLAAADTSVALQAPEPAAPETSKSFFKSPKGVMAVVLFAAGVTFTFVSKSHDRVKSPIRN